MKLKTKFYLVAALLLMLLGYLVGRMLTVFAVLLVVGIVLFLTWPFIKRAFRKVRRV